jgi:spermidine synthase
MPLQHLSTIETPDGHKLSLHERDGDFFISLDGLELMSTRAHDSETALAQRACATLPPAPKPVRVLIGGLGLGFTLQAALAALPRNAEVVVAELFPTIPEWHRDHLGELGRTIEDPRAKVVERDVADLISPQDRPWHAILLDVDNGPDAPCVDRNRRLYTREGIERMRDSLVRGGILGVWSIDRDPAYVKRLGRAGMEAWTETVHAHAGKGSKHTLFFARRPA